jgi:hypothetical protein
VTAAPNRPTKLYTLDLGFPPAAREHDDGKTTKALEKRLEAFIVTGIATLENELIAPPMQAAR